MLILNYNLRVFKALVGFPTFGFLPFSLSLPRSSPLNMLVKSNSGTQELEETRLMRVHQVEMLFMCTRIRAVALHSSDVCMVYIKDLLTE